MKEVLVSFLTAVGHELSKDRAWLFALVIVLLWSFVHTHNEALLQLLVTGVGGFIGLMRSGAQQQNIASGEGSSVKTEPAEAKA